MNSPIKKEQNNSMDLQCSNKGSNIVRGSARVFAKTGLWNETEKQKYILFLLHHQGSFKEGVQVPKGIFQKMARFIRTRKVSQCRLYHQKLERYFESVGAIIRYLSKKMDNKDNKAGQNAIMKDQIVQLPLQRFANEQKDAIIRQEDSKNDEEQIQKIQTVVKRKEKKKLSLKLEDDEEQEDEKDDLLAKTDQTIQNVPSKTPPHRHHGVMKPSLPLNFGQFISTPVHQPLPFHYQPSPIPLPQFPSIPLTSETPVQWLNCQALYQAWRHRIEYLLSISTSNPFN